MVKFDVRGLVAPVFTPVAEDNSIAYDVVPKYFEYLLSHGITQFVVGGTSGEAACLNVAERKRLTETWMEAAQGNTSCRIVAQVGGAPLPDVLELARHAENIGVAAIMTLPELYFKPRSEEELVSYLKRVADAAPSLPLIYYHFPMMSGVQIDVQKFFRLAVENIPTFCGMKADLDVARLVADQLDENKRIFIGNHFLAASASEGFDSSIATVTNLFPEDVKSVVETSKICRTEGQFWQEKLNSFVQAIASQGDWVPSMKVAMEMVTDVKVGPPRPPLTPLTPEQVRKVRENLDNVL